MVTWCTVRGVDGRRAATSRNMGPPFRPFSTSRTTTTTSPPIFHPFTSNLQSRLSRSQHDLLHSSSSSVTIANATTARSRHRPRPRSHYMDAETEPGERGAESSSALLFCSGDGVFACSAVPIWVSTSARGSARSFLLRLSAGSARCRMGEEGGERKMGAGS